MSERNDASRLDKDWDNLVQTPRAARRPTGSGDTIGQLHALDTPESPDPAFRTQLRQQLLRENAYRTGQDRTGTIPAATPVAGTSGPTNRFSRLMEVIAVAVIVLLVGTALIFAVELRGDHDEEDLTPTFELAATSTNLIVASPESTVPPTTTPKPSPTVTSEPSETSTRESTNAPSATSAPSETSEPEATETAAIVASATEVTDACADISGLITTVSSTLAATELPPNLRGSFPATSGQIDAVNVEFDSFVTCLEAIPSDASDDDSDDDGEDDTSDDGGGDDNGDEDG